MGKPQYQVGENIKIGDVVILGDDGKLYKWVEEEKGLAKKLEYECYPKLWNDSKKQAECLAREYLLPAETAFSPRPL